jgi:hypothetical protein
MDGVGRAVRKAVWVAAVFAAMAGAAAADDISINLAGLRVYNGFIPSGADVALSWSGFDLGLGAPTALVAKFGGGYEDKPIARDPATGDPKGAADSYLAPNFQWEAGVEQAIVPGSGDAGNVLEAFLIYRGRYDSYSGLDAYSGRWKDAAGLFETAALAGLAFDTVAVDDHYLKRGVYAEASAEWAPGAVNPASDYWRTTAILSGYYPVFDLASPGRNLLSAYLAGFASFDYADGSAVPIYVQTSFGGRKPRDGLGGSVRGYFKSSFDTAAKAVANAELRLVGPALGLPSLVPYLIGFADVGWYSGFRGSTAFADASGVLASAGGVLSVELAGAAQLGVSAGVRLTENAVVPRAAGSPSFLDIVLNLHF